ncbi:hypothetical protein LTR95_014281 [Oleoguttula sp. CCFEE 5521]
MYWTKDPFYSGGDSHGTSWSSKEDKLVWRGSASGGRNKAENWIRFQRHRFVKTGLTPPNFVLPSSDSYTLASSGALAPWLADWSDAAVVHLLCFPNDNNAPTCPYTDPYFHVAKALPMSAQYSAKYLPDIDGNSFSGRYLAFLGSTSLPIKATIYNEWHDSRLVPWIHFVPMDNTFADVYGIMEYFLGNDRVGLEGHDEVAERIASAGKKWKERVLRREDLLGYVFRVLLEFARGCDEGRGSMGWAGET